ncbi:SAM-dependent methyltransferase [Streptomyces sp. SAI-149]|uniref:SAM-dependent methyltransferase n=1 Tax=unclassified Streptomyces TaxID=2593676 RepID=UPI002476EA69|nr:SAM-dependent methyltransferase [Streptomyces sp. SAI-149]MDH6493800.1 SAM-dependent methyltransferase [Streptomyces sp. SAI-149]
MDWQKWQDRYDTADSPLARRLVTVQERIRLALDDCPPGPLQVVSLCAGQGRDLLGVLPDHPRGQDVRGRLVELDPRNVDVAAEAASSAELHGIEAIAADAALLDHYDGMVPADLVLICGVFGNIVERDIERTINACTQLCKAGGRVIWTRNRKTPDRVPLICDWFEERGFEREWVTAPDELQAVGVHRFTGQPQSLEPGTRLFTFVGYDKLQSAT